jgi:hypothetical protein
LQRLWSLLSSSQDFCSTVACVTSYQTMMAASSGTHLFVSCYIFL